MLKKTHRPNQAARMQQPDLTTQFFNPPQAGAAGGPGPRSKRQQQHHRRNEVSFVRKHQEQSMETRMDEREYVPDTPAFCVSRLHKEHTNETQTTAISQALSQLGLNNNECDRFKLSADQFYQDESDESQFQPSVLTNPFADRRRETQIGTDVLATSYSFSSTQPHFMLEDSHLKNMLSPGLTSFRNVRKEQIPPWWKSRSFSSATCFYPQNNKSKGIGNQSDIDDCLLSSYDNRATSEAPYKSLSLKEKWARIKAKKKVLRRPVEVENFDEIEADEEIMGGKGIMLNKIVHQSSNGSFMDTELLWKYQQDVHYIKEIILKETDGNVDAIRDLRFLIASVQTYGNIDGICYPAEFAMNEFTLLSGIVERFHAVVGPWALDNETQRRRASRHAYETHQIPLQHHCATMSKRKVVEEILGRTEPGIAIRQGVKVGLYSASCDEAFKIHLHVKNSFKDSAMVTDEEERRFILVLQNEYHVMIESMRQLGNSIGLQYEGFPTTPNRFILVESFIDAMSEILGESTSPDVIKWFSNLGNKEQEPAKSFSSTSSSLKNEFSWEKNLDLHCTRHAPNKNSCCAQVTVCRANFMLLQVLGTFFRQYHVKKYPANKSVPPTPVLSLLPSLRAATNNSQE